MKQLNKAYILFQLREAAESIRTLIQEIEDDPDYDIGAYTVDMMHLYHHVNTAWNARYSTKEESDACSEEDYERWRRYPNDLEIT
ncbi:MAG TPA: hypothetical protein VF339_06535 [Gammaproteobacteria bacterium]